MFPVSTISRNRIKENKNEKKINRVVMIVVLRPISFPNREPQKNPKRGKIINKKSIKC